MPDSEAPRVLLQQRHWAYYGQDQRFQAQIVSEMYGGRALTKALWRRIVNKLVGYRTGFQPGAIYNGLVVFHRPELNGGGLTHGQNLCRALLEFGLSRCERLCEFCAGPGYIGYSLFANGFCERLTLVDINPEALAAARLTAQYNHIEDFVHIYLSDGLAAVPEGEKWDLVVGNPPAFLLPRPGEPDAIAVDANWQLHRRFYASVKKHMNSGGAIVLVGDRGYSDAATFEPMIQSGGGRLAGVLYETNLEGRELEKYYVCSRW